MPHSSPANMTPQPTAAAIFPLRLLRKIHLRPAHPQPSPRPKTTSPRVALQSAEIIFPHQPVKLVRSASPACLQLRTPSRAAPLPLHSVPSPPQTQTRPSSRRRIPRSKSLSASAAWPPKHRYPSLPSTQVRPPPSSPPPLSPPDESTPWSHEPLPPHQGSP